MGESREVKKRRDFEKLIVIRRPRKRGECPREKDYKGGVCPWVGCRYHLYLHVQPNGVLKVSFPDLDVDEIPETCALRVAERGEHTLEAIGKLLNVTRERVRQIEAVALEKLAAEVAVMTCRVEVRIEVESLEARRTF